MRVFMLVVTMILMVTGCGKTETEHTIVLFEREVVYKHTATKDLRMYITLPEGWKETDKRSAVVMIFGGDWTWNNYHMFDDRARMFASRGFVVFQIDYRVRQDGGGITPFDSTRDGKTAIRYVRTHASTLGVDVERIAAMGASAGSQIAACTVMCEGFDEPWEDSLVSSRANALILLDVALDLSESEYTASDPAGAVAISPMRTAAHSRTVPTFIQTSELDYRNAQAYSVCTSLSERGETVECITIPDADHGISSMAPQKERIASDALHFLRKQGF